MIGVAGMVGMGHGSGRRRTSSSEGSRMFDLVKIPNPFQEILGVGESYQWRMPIV